MNRQGDLKTLKSRVSEEPWIEWDGKGPYPTGCVNIRLRDGFEPDAEYNARHIGWLPIGSDDDIVAYRLARALAGGEVEQKP